MMRRALIPLCLIALIASSAGAATITIVNLDGASEGFNDPTPAAPVGGNPGTTIGQQRLNVFEHAAAIWGAILPSSVTIVVEANFDPQSCTAMGAVLGSAGPNEVAKDFAGAVYPNTWYHMALANKRSGVDQSPGVADIGATFNSSLEDAGCLGATTWYYGFDSNEGTNIELLPVVLHELGHGLGFSTFVNLGSGDEFLGFPDVFEHFLRDNTAGTTWPTMSSAERVTSAVNTENVVWSGPSATRYSTTFLGHPPLLRVKQGIGLALTYPLGTAAFGPDLTVKGVRGDVVLVSDSTGTPSDACSAIKNAVAGKIALIDRGACTFISKAQQAEAAGAIAVIIVDNVAAGTPPSLGGAGTVNIPTVSMRQADGAAIKNALNQGVVNVVLQLDENDISGADGAGRVQLYAPNPVQGGSSISHFDISANPNLLMEPFINTNLTDDVDLTRELFYDIGWLNEFVGTPDVAGQPRFLAANTPNPFSTQTTLTFALETAGPVKLEIFDLSGRRVRRLVDAPLPAHSHSVVWDGKDDAGRDAASGIYLYRLVTGERTESRRMVLSR